MFFVCVIFFFNIYAFWCISLTGQDFKSFFVFFLTGYVLPGGEQDGPQEPGRQKCAPEG